jgi:trehalose-6-phosphate synthase
MTSGKWGRAGASPVFNHGASPIDRIAVAPAPNSTKAMRAAVAPSETQILVLSNREPYQHEHSATGQLQVRRCSSGVVNAVEPLLLENSGVWVAAGSGAADRETAVNADGVEVPPDAPRYRLRRVWLTEAETKGYYYGFANTGLWPLCHRTSVTPTFYAQDFGVYELVNRRFAEAVAEEARVPGPVILVQDYHFALAPAMIRRQLPLSRIATFWHIPWPGPQAFRRCPWSNTLLEGLLGSSLIGFQTPLDRDNFLRCAEQLTDVDVDATVVNWKGRRVQLGVYPASVEWPGQAALAPSIAACRAEVRRLLDVPDDTVVGLGVDRLDYTKGLEEKLLAVERMLECRPDLRQRFVFVQIAQPSREALPAYRQTQERLFAAAERINQRFSGTARSIVLLPSYHDQAAITRYMRAADFCYVGSLHDGMNLVSKEFVAARDDDRGVLVLSAYAGASHELRDALIVNPYDREQSARSLAAAIDMPVLQQRFRMRRLRRTVASFDARSWATRLLEDVVRDPQPCARPLAHYRSVELVQVPLS